MTSSRGTADRAAWLRRAAASRWTHWGVLALVMLWTMRGWLDGRLPATPRMEMVVQFATSWFIADEARQGRWLTPWNPWEFGGFPWMRLLAWPVYTIMALIALAGIPMETALKALLFAGFAASGVAMYELARVLTGRWQAALVSGLVYMIAPFHVQTAVDWWEFVPFWALLPLPFLFYELALRRPEKRGRFLALAALSLGLFPWASPERTLVCAVWFGLYAVAREGVRLARREARWKPAALRLATVGGLGALVALAMVYPAFADLSQLGAYHMRGSEGGAATALLADYSASPRLLLSALLQRLKMPVDTATLPTIWKSFGSLFAWYLGWPVLGLAALGLVQARKYIQVWIAAVLAILALWLAFGPTVAFNPFQHLPLFSTLIPFRALMLVVFCLALLAGFGLLTLSNWLRQVPAGAWAAVVLAVIVVDFRPASAVFTGVESYFTADERAAYEFVTSQPGDWRLWEPNGVLQTRYVASYSLPLAPVPRFSGHWVEGAPIRAWEMLDWGDQSVALDVLSVRYALLRKADPEYQRLREQAETAGFGVKVWDSASVEVWENPTYRPFVTLRKPETVSLFADTLPTALGGEPVAGQAAYVRESPTRIRVSATVAEPALLTVSEGWHPNWTVSERGYARELLRVDYMLQGVLLEPGEHELLFQYEEGADVIATRWVSIVGVVALVALAVLNPRAKRLGETAR